jgi:TolB-like protein
MSFSVPTVQEPPLRIQILGRLDIRSSAGAPARFATRKAALLTAALALAGEKGVRRDALAEACWPGRAEPQARSSLRQALVETRRVLGRKNGTVQIEGEGDVIRMTAQPDDIDVRRFDRLAAPDDPEALARAADLYQGDLLADAALPAPLDQWFAPFREEYRRKALTLVERMSEVEGPAAADTACEALAQRLLAADGTAEEAHRALIRLYRRQGRMNAALRQFELCKDTLARELGVAPEARTQALMAPEQDALPPAAPAAAQGRSESRPLVARDRDQPSVVVMPFDNLSGEADEYFVDGIVEEITAALSRVREFFVIARQSAFTYKNRFVYVRQIGAELDVYYVVEGTVRRGGDRLRISVQLVDSRTRAQLWSNRYEGLIADIFEFQDRIAGQVAGAIHPAIRTAEINLAVRKPPSNLNAYDLVLRAYPKLWSAKQRENKEAIALLESAVAADPHYGRAHAFIAWCCSQDVVYFWSDDPGRDMARIHAAIDAASRNNIDDDPAALAAIGAALSQSVSDQVRAKAYVERALALDPNSAWAWARYGWIALFSDEARPARERFERARALSPLDPLDFNLRIGIASSHGLEGDFAEAARQFREILREHPAIVWANRQFATYSALAGDLPTAREAMRRLITAYPHVSVKFMRENHPMRNTPRVFEMMLKGWRLAGLPEG